MHACSLACVREFYLFLAIASIISSPSTPKMLVGDPHQQIYAFRGATNILSGVAAKRTFYLTQVRDV